MSEQSPCPGPYVNRHFNRSGSIDIDAGAHKLARVYCRELPGGVCTNEAIAEAEATANLLCAAPELLDALDVLLQASVGGGRQLGEELRAAGEAALAAITKVRGKR